MTDQLPPLPDEPRLVPQNLDAEEAVLGAVMLSPGLLPMLDLRPADFYIHRHGWIWEAYQALHAKGQALDFITVTETLDAMGKLKECGGPAKLAGLLGNVISTLNAETHAGIIKDMAARRELIHLANDLARVAMDYHVNLDDIRPVFVDELVRSRTQHGAVHIAAWVEEALQEIEKRAAQGEIPLLKTGFTDIDAFIGGLDASEGTQFILGGEPGTGKTILLGNIAFNMAEHTPGALYSMEMKRLRMMMRAFSAGSKISAWEMRRGHVQESEWPALINAAEETRHLKMYVSDHSNWNTSTLRADLTRLKYQYGIQWYMLDYMKLLTDDTWHNSREHERLEEISKRLMKINRDLQLCSIVIHTMTKDNFTKNSLSGGAFAGGAGLQYDMDIGAVMVKSDMQQGGVFEYRKLMFTKNRDGETPLGDVTLGKHKQYPLFVTPYIKVENHKNGHLQNGRELLEYSK